MNISSPSTSFKVISSSLLASSLKKRLKAVICSFNPDLQNTLLWLLFQDLMVIVRGSLAHGGMCMCICVGSTAQFSA